MSYPGAPGIEVSTDPARVDVDLLHRWLSEDAYWALGRPRSVVERALAASTSVAAYDGVSGAMVGYARLVTDGATFAWLCDVYVDPARRGDGVGKALVGRVHEELVALGVKRALLATADAHGLYAQAGFAPLVDPERWMIATFPPSET